MPYPPPFRFKQFSLHQEGVAHPVGTDSVLLGALADVSSAARVLDIGTGTGAIALMLAQRGREAGRAVQIQGIDIHAGSVQCAQQNALASPWKDQVQILQSPVQAYCLEQAESFDLIVSNPPFFSDLTYAPDETRRLGRYTGTLSPGDLLTSVKGMLQDQGLFYVILPVREAQRLCEMAVLMGLYWTKIIKVQSLPGKAIERWVVEFQKNPVPFSRSSLLIYASPNCYSQAYKDLTRDFYVHF